MLTIPEAFDSVNDRLALQTALVVKPLKRKGEDEWAAVKRIVAMYLFIASRFPNTHDAIRSRPPLSAE